jgi:hypothetical protein
MFKQIISAGLVEAITTKDGYVILWTHDENGQPKATPISKETTSLLLDTLRSALLDVNPDQKRISNQSDSKMKSDDNTSGAASDQSENRANNKLRATQKQLNYLNDLLENQVLSSGTRAFIRGALKKNLTVRGASVIIHNATQELKLRQGKESDQTEEQRVDDSQREKESQLSFDDLMNCV